MSSSRVTVVSLALVGVISAFSTSAHATGTTVLHSFAAPNSGKPAALPQSALVMDQNGNLFGSTENGTDSKGTIFKVADNNAYTVLHTFGTDIHTTGDLTADTDGNIYGTTWNGGASNWGSVFSIDRESGYALVASFAGTTGGLQPYGGVVRDAAGNLYGTTRYGGNMSCQGGSGCGNIYKVSPTGTLSILHTFSGTDGMGHQWGFTRVGDKLWGTASGGAVSGVWMNIKTDGTSYTYGSFTAAAYTPTAGLVKSRASGSTDMWGTTAWGGANGLGSIVKVTAAGTLSLEYSFTSTTGARPVGRLVVDADNNIYGVTQGNGTGSGATLDGTIFKYVPSTGTLTTLQVLSSTLGRVPMAGLMMDAGKRLYGTTTAGGTNSNGTVFRYDP